MLIRAPQRALRLQIDRSDGSDDPGVYMNRAVEKMLGYSREEVPTLCAWFKALYRDGAAEAKRLYDEDQKHVSGTQACS